MPGVSKNGLTITQDLEKNQIRFCGKVPSIKEFPERIRAYASVINLDTNLGDIQMNHSLVNGSLRFVFPKTQGSLQILKYRGGKAVDQSDDHLIFAPLTPSNCEINPLMIGSTRSCIIKKFVNTDGGSINVLHILVDTPGMEDFTFDINHKTCIIRGAEEEEEDKSNFLKSERKYLISMIFDCSCCTFDAKGTKRRHQILKDGLLHLQLRVSSSSKLITVS
uniref:Uncharacterized protein n=1 Tax=Chenopodium quinoa TaxID=63459 RepID=A0A803LTR2_CHEQI